MTRLPGTSLENSGDPFEPDNEGPWIHELKLCLNSMRMWRAYSDENHICSVLGTSIQSTRVPNHIMGPFTSERGLTQYLLSAASAHGFKSREEYDKALVRAKRIDQHSHRVTFTHGDFKAHNILVDDDGHLSGFLDWESAGWYPEYWDYTTAMRFGQNSWWYQVAMWMGGDQYLEELNADIALNLLTVDSYIAIQSLQSDSERASPTIKAWVTETEGSRGAMLVPNFQTILLQRENAATADYSMLNQLLQDSQNPHAAGDVGNRIDLVVMHSHDLIKLDVSRLRDVCDLNEDAEEVRLENAACRAVIGYPPST
ncbi:hypothetical protein LOZ51_005976 [Ophidiomyces ophidiicola]|nr:hypothetical protein LOZ55_005803 [Ophidiomyces ophidiicola]KAI1986815.1 hypothetical protein LOZ51_005976 [Ophidiomyces ophidiicola]KAI1996361.1 hypothetical protein LOZ54_000234 [Ophidiomyces ophidiicola]